MIAIRPLLILSFLLLATIATGQNNRDSLLNRTILFKVTHPKSSHTSYLFGTHHAFGKLFFDSLANANQCLSQCDLLIKENLNIPGHLAEDIINSRTATTTWSKFLSKEDLAYVKNLFASSPTDYNKMTPTEMYVFLNRYFKQQFCLAKDTADTSITLDDYIGLKARQQHLTLIGLETTEEQIELINKDVEGMPGKVHKKRLLKIITTIQSKNTNACAETDWYRKMEIEYQLNQPCTNTLVLTDRNNKWMKTIQQHLNSNNCFIAVGLSHFMYQCGLIKQLQKLGYEVTAEKVN